VTAPGPRQALVDQDLADAGTVDTDDGERASVLIYALAFDFELAAQQLGKSAGGARGKDPFGLALTAGFGRVNVCQAKLLALQADRVAVDHAGDRQHKAAGLLLGRAISSIAALGTAGGLAAYSSFPSREEAVGLRKQIVAAATVAREAVGTLVDGTIAGEASVACQAVSTLAAAAAADINEAIGRLPAVIVFATLRDTDAFLLANQLDGDRPETIEAGYRSIVTRNGPRHPARLPAGRVEALKP